MYSFISSKTDEKVSLVLFRSFTRDESSWYWVIINPFQNHGNGEIFHQCCVQWIILLGSNYYAIALTHTLTYSHNTHPHTVR